jgi:hypothetical protein
MHNGAGEHGKHTIAEHQSLTAANFLSKLPPGFAGNLTTPKDSNFGAVGNPEQEITK